MDIKALFNEAVLTSDGSGQVYNSLIWNPETGAELRNLLGGRSAQNSLRTFGLPRSLLYAISSNKDKMQLLVWNLYAGDAPVAKITMQGPVTSLAITKDGAFCVSSIDTHIYIWMMATGDLLCVLSRHFSSISCLKLCPLEDYLVSAGSNGALMVWDMKSLLCGVSNQEPLHEWRAHNMGILDIAVGKLFVVTASEDQTCKMFSLRDGQLVSTISVGESVTAVATNISETILLAGTSRGSLYSLRLGQKIDQEYQAQNTNFRHSGRINAIAISHSGLFFVTCSNDHTAKVWDTKTLTVLQSKTFRGQVTNVNILLNYNPHRTCTDLCSLPFTNLVRQPMEAGERPESLEITGAYAQLNTEPEPSCLTKKLKELEEKAQYDMAHTIIENKQKNEYMFNIMMSSMLQEQ